MLITHRINRGWTSGSGAGFSYTQEVTADGENNRIVAVAGATNNKEVAFVLDVSQCKALAFFSDKAVTIETNDGADADNVFVLPANTPWIWVTGDPAMKDTTGTAVEDITALFITNAGADAAEVQIGCLVDSTLA